MKSKRDKAANGASRDVDAGEKAQEIERDIKDERDPAVIRARLNTETARIAWQELAPHFARGSVVVVAAGLDLVEVAAAFVEDRQQDVAAWLDAGQIERAQDEHAERWNRDGGEVWAVVVAPWVLVQEAASR